MATACRQPLDDATLEFYHEALSREADAVTWEAFTLRAAGDGEFRDVTGTVWFPKLPDLREAYARDRTKALPFVRPPLMRDPWETPADFDVYLDAVRANPKGATEGAGTYIARIAGIVAKGSLAPAVKAWPKERPRVQAEPAYEERLRAIYERDPGEEG